MTANTPPQKFRLVALDLDGTLLQSNHTLSEKTKAGIRELHAKGVGIMFATGRALSTVYEHIVDLNLSTPLPVVCFNGGAAYLCTVDPAAGPHGVRCEEVFCTPVPHPVATACMRLAIEQDYVCQYYVQDQIYAHPTTDSHYELTEQYMELTGSKTIYLPKEEFAAKVVSLGLPIKQLVLFPTSQQDAALEIYQEAMTAQDLLVDGQPATLVRGSLGWFLEVLPPAIHKGAGLQRLCAHLNIPLAATVAFGDGDNDYEFLQMAGRGIVMKNGRTVVKKIADQITDYTNDEDGVLLTLIDLDKQSLLAKTR
jgi:Cof subfamily protein (haloacid dehalogenase superfamily)